MVPLVAPEPRPANPDRRGPGLRAFRWRASLERFGITAVVAEIGDAALPRGRGADADRRCRHGGARIGLDRAVIDRGIVLEQIAHAEPLGNRGR